MPRLDLNLELINGLRHELAQLKRQQAELDTRVAEQQTLLGSARRRGLSGRELEQLAAVLNSLAGRSPGLAAREGNLCWRLTGLLMALRGQAGLGVAPVNERRASYRAVSGEDRNPLPPGAATLRQASAWS